MMRAGSVDIGTNTILLLVGDIDPTGIRQILHDEQVIARLGQGVDRNRIILPVTVERACSFLLHYRDVCDQLGVERIIATGTSALRDARNSTEFRRIVSERTGIDIEIISGESEAEWTYKGAISDFPGLAGDFTVLDIGGGSTEIIHGNRSGIIAKASHDIGCVRLTEQHLHQGPPPPQAIAAARRAVRDHFPADLRESASGTHVVGVAGTLTTLASLDQNLPKYDPLKVSGYRLTRKAVDGAFDRLSRLTVEEIRSIPQASPGRADIITAGVVILQEFMELAGLTEIIVSDRGLRYGMLLREVERMRSATP